MQFILIMKTKNRASRLCFFPLYFVKVRHYDFLFENQMDFRYFNLGCTISFSTGLFKVSKLCKINVILIDFDSFQKLLLKHSPLVKIIDVLILLIYLLDLMFVWQ